MAETTTIACPFILVDEDGNKCAEELVVEWEQYPIQYKTGKRICYMCEKYEDQVDPLAHCTMDNCLEELTAEDLEKCKHQWQDEWDEKYETRLLSLKSWCFHPLTKEQVQDQLEDEWQAGAERAAEARY